MALLGCGGPDTGPATKPPPPKVVKKKTAEAREKERSRKRIEESSLPEDAKKELEEAQDLLENP